MENYGNFRGTPMSDTKTNVHVEEKYERCICCKEQTNVLRATPVDEREYFIHGCGQLCPSCYRELTQTEKEQLDKYMERIVKQFHL